MANNNTNTLLSVDRTKILFGPTGRPIRALASYPSFDATGTGRRLFKWTASESGPNSLVFLNASTLRSRARDLVRKNPWAVKAVDAYVSEVVGAGITPQFRHPKASVRKKLQTAWRVWTDEADSDGLTDLYGLQALACRAVMEGGESLIRLRPRFSSDGLSVPLQLQLLEPEHLPIDKNETLPNGFQIRAGIEFNAINKRVGYHFYRSHPGDASIFSDAGQITRVPATEVMHVFRPLRPGQIRGLPWLFPILVKLYELDKYEDAELVRKGTTAMFGGFITTPAGTPSPLLGSTSLDDGTTADTGTDFVGLEPGSFVDLDPGQNVEFSAPADVGGMYIEFLTSHLRGIAAALGITYEQLTGDLTKVNFSSSRVGLQTIRRAMEQFQYMVLVFQFCRPTINYWLDSAALAGVIDSRDYSKNRALYRDVEWKMPPWPFINPIDDVKAEVLQIRSGLKSRSASIIERGLEPEQVDQEIAQDNKRADNLGLVLDSDARRTAQSGAASTATTPASEDQSSSNTDGRNPDRPPDGFEDTNQSSQPGVLQ